MIPAPRASDYENIHHWNETQTEVVILLMYLSMILYILMLSMTGHNVWVFLIKQKRYKTTGPLVLFYFLAVLIGCLRFYFSLFYFQVLIEFNIIVILLEPIVKLFLGVTQCWITVELATRIRYELKITANMMSGF